MIAEYIWIDGSEPTARLRSKTKIFHEEVEEWPLWSFDGSSTNQATGDRSDCILQPAAIINDPLRDKDNVLILCEVFNADGTPHPSNNRAKLREALKGHEDLDAWVGFEQEYTLFSGSRPLGFPSERRFPPAQGPYYCGVGSDEVSGRALVEKHLDMCLKAKIPLTGINAEVMPGQWEYQVGGPNVDPLAGSDFVWLSRWLLYRLGEHYELTATLDPKPVPGDWNGAGMHTNFSTRAMRQEGGLEEIYKAVDAIGNHIKSHLDRYGNGIESRLTGLHETCRYDVFKAGVSDRTASIRIPLETAKRGCGYFEDRRPNANADPYLVSEALIRSITGTW
jgi:glutamine synthetase